MIKTKIAATLGAAALLLPFAASAATLSSTAIFDGQNQVYGTSGQSFQATFQVHVSAGEVLHAVRTKVAGQPTVCTPVGPWEGDQTVNVGVNIVLPPNSNASAYNLTGDFFTTDTLPQAQAMTGDLACSNAGPGAHSATLFNSNVVNVLPSSGSSTGTGSSASTTGQFSDLWAQLNGLKALFASLTQTVIDTVGPKPICKNVPTDTLSLQNFLRDNGGYLTQAQINTGPGVFGPRTTAAFTLFKIANRCI